MDFSEFILAHDSDDVARLLLSRGRWPDVDVALAADTILSRRKLRSKVPVWYSIPALRLPSPLSAEQCSSEETARYKAGVAGRILLECTGKAASGCCIADLTGGLGVDSQAFSMVAGKVIYNEMDPALAGAAGHNFPILGMDNVRVCCTELSAGTLGAILGDDVPDILFLDPARRSGTGRKVFLLEDCSPDMVSMQDELFGACRHILLKVSPMADITMLVSRLAHVREVHVVAAGGECKELLLWMDREWTGEYGLVLYDSGYVMRVEGPVPEAVFLDGPSALLSCEGGSLFVPGKALSKAGVSDLACARGGFSKLGWSTGLYVAPPDAVLGGDPLMKRFGKVFRIVRILPLNRKGMKEAASRWPHCSVSARNLPLDTASLRSRLGVSEGEQARIFGGKTDFRTSKSEGFLIVTEWDVRNID